MIFECQNEAICEGMFGNCKYFDQVFGILEGNGKVNLVLAGYFAKILLSVY